MTKEGLLLLKDKIVILTGFKNKVSIVLLIDDILTENFCEVVKRGYYNVREATLDEKKIWFENYDQDDKNYDTNNNKIGMFLD